VSETRCEVLARALRAAAGFGTRALRIHSRRRLAPDSLRLLEEAAAGYARVEWSLPQSPSR
jgi:hypothetical protein